MRGPSFPLRGILGHDSRSPSLSIAPPVFFVIVWSESPLGGQSAGWAPQSPAASGRAQSSVPRTGPGARALSDSVRALPGARSALACRCRYGERTARRGTLCRRPLCTLHSPLRRRAGGAGHPLYLGDARRWVGSAFPPHQLSPTSRGPPGATARGRFRTARHWGHFGSWMSSSTVAFLFLPPFDSLSAPLPHSFCMSFCL